MSKVINGSTIELGASIYHISNELVYNLTTELGLKRIKGFDDGFGVWNGTAFTFETSQLKYEYRKLLKRKPVYFCFFFYVSFNFLIFIYMFY